MSIGSMMEKYCGNCILRKSWRKKIPSKFMIRIYVVVLANMVSSNRLVAK